VPIQGIEWLFISLILLILIMWDPQKIPQLARALVEARREYEKAASAVQEVIQEVQREAERGEVSERGADHSEKDLDKRIIETARELGIETYGKTRQEIVMEIHLRRLKTMEPGGGGQESSEKEASQAISNPEEPVTPP